MILSRFVTALAVAVLVAGLQAAFAHAGEKKEQKKDEAEGRKGKTIGILTAKGPNFIEVKADGEEKGRRYIPQWLGGDPKAGGGLDKAVLKVFHELKVGSRVEVDWVFEERFRALKVKVLRAPDGADKKNEVRTGRTIGVVISKGDKFIEVKADGEEKPRKYHARYLQGPPPGFDPEILKQFAKTPLESRVLLEWVATNHGPIVHRIEVLKEKKADKE